MIQFFLGFLVALRASFRARADAALEILALRQQLAVLKRKNPRPSGSFSSALLMILSNSAGTEALSCTGAVGAPQLTVRAQSADLTTKKR